MTRNQAQIVLGVVAVHFTFVIAVGIRPQASPRSPTMAYWADAGRWFKYAGPTARKIEQQLAILRSGKVTSGPQLRAWWAQMAELYQEQVGFTPPGTDCQPSRKRIVMTWVARSP
jgi:hypothetical protein